MASIYLVRHGQASFGSSHYDRLSARGREQATLLGRYWQDRGHHFDRVVCGDLERQRDTADLALAEMPGASPKRQEDTRFNEFDHEKVAALMLPRLATRDEQVAAFVAGQIDRKANFQHVFEKIVTEWTSQDDWGSEMESWSQFVDRVNTGLEALIDSADAGENVLVVTSGGPITAMLARLLKLSPETAFELNWSIANASVTKIRFNRQGRRSLAYFNHYAYLQSGADTSLITLR